MAEYTQTKQPMRIDTVLGEDALLLERLTGREAVSESFLFELDLVSENGEIDGEELLRSEMRVDVDLPDGSTRAVHGMVRRFVQKGGGDRDLVSYRAEIVPWTWFLSLVTDYRIFQDKDVLEIAEEVFTARGYSDFDIRCTRSYPKRPYCVQYRESDLNFVSRLLEEEGIFYFFEHEESRHVLVLADDMISVGECEGQEEARMYVEPLPDEDVVLELEREHVVHPGRVTLADYDHLQPSLTLRSTVVGEEPEEIYEYPGSFRDLDGGDRLARLALEREEARRHVVRGSGTCRGFWSGGRFRLTDHFRDDANQSYALLEVRHQAHNAALRTGRQAGEFDFRNEFVAIPHSVPYRPPRRTRKPVVQGAQTAEVVGPSGEKIWTDQHGRVKVQFHWDRQGGRDANSSCWVRVSQNWAGKSWGGMFVPHVGQEVIVDFLEGDPDRPIVTGRVYNAERMPPLKLPKNQHKSIIQDDFGNEIVFDATPGGEHIRIHSPSHKSAVEIGKSVRWSTVSDWYSHVKGDSGFINEGANISGTIGFKGSVDLCSSLSVFAGYKIELEAAQKLEVKLGPSLKLSAGKEYKAGKSESTQHYSGKILLNSDKELLLVGGPGDESAIDGDGNALTLQYGKNPIAQKVKPDLKMKIGVAAGTVASVASAVGATRAWEGLTVDEDDDEEADGEGETEGTDGGDDAQEDGGDGSEGDDDEGDDEEGMDGMSYGILGAGGLLGIVPSAGMAIYDKVKEVKVPDDFGTMHSPVHSKVKLSEEGILLEAGTTKVTIKKNGDVLINSKSKITLTGDAGVSLNSNKELTFSAPQVAATQGIFKSKNINDLGA